MIDKEYLRQIAAFPLLTREQEIELGNRIITGDTEAQQTLINSNLRLVVSIAKHYINKSSLPFEDLVQEGNIGLIKAVNKFDPTRGNRFSTCASWYIKHEIARAIEDKARIVRKPVYMLEKLNKLQNVERELFVELQHDPTDDEIAARLGEDVETIILWRSYLADPVSADIKIGEEEDAPSISEMIADSSDGPEDYMLDIDNKETIDRVLQTLDEREREVIRYRYGLDDENYKTLDETGANFHLTKERVRQIEASAMRKLRNPLRAKMLRSIRDA